MKLFYLWIFFNILIGISQSDAEHYFLFCACMFYFSYIYNIMYSVELSYKLFIILWCIPSVIIWWILYVHNYLLRIEPFDECAVIFLIFFYFYLLLFFFFESDKFWRV